ncbi:MAG: hypothetical protein Q8L79_18275 [Methylobacter sp.]|nr:hypothetical protein [Methylobacter sp.]
MNAYDTARSNNRFGSVRFAVIFNNKYNRTSVSKNGLSVFMGFQAVELEVGGQAPPIFAQPG